jgi:hypothetical protein
MRFCLKYLRGVMERRERVMVREKRGRKRWRTIEASLTALAQTRNQEVCPESVSSQML